MRLLQVIGWSALALLSMASDGAEAQGDSVAGFVRQRFIHGVPYEQASRFNADAALPVLLPMLESNDAAASRANVATTLGMIGDRRAVKPLISLVERGQGQLSRAEYNARTAAVTALGLILNKQASPEALTYLANGVTPANWEKTPVAWTGPFDATPPERNFQLAQMAMIALGYSGGKDADKILNGVRTRSKEWAPYFGDHPGREAAMRQLLGTLDEAIVLNRRIAADGLQKYFSTVRQ